jgi:hypothetical protein
MRLLRKSERNLCWLTINLFRFWDPTFPQSAQRVDRLITLGGRDSLNQSKFGNHNQFPLAISSAIWRKEMKLDLRERDSYFESKD